MSESQSEKSVTRYGKRKAINLYRDNTLALWKATEESIRERYNAEDASQGEVAAQVFAEYLGAEGPLDHD